MHRILGKTNLKVFVIGFGGIPIRVLSVDDAVKVIRRAYELGVNFYDTARGYGDSERKIGLALRDVRKNAIIATKTSSRDYDGAMRDLERSLSELNVDYIDIWQLHNVSDLKALERVLSDDGALQALRDARQDGRVRFIGITGHNTEILLKAMEAYSFDTVQFPFNYLADDAKYELIPKANKLGLGIIIMKPLAGGELSHPLAALRYILSYEVSVVIPGMKSIGEVEENVNSILANPSLSDDELRLIEEDRAKLNRIFCRGCMYCMPCPNDIPISSLLRIKQFINRTGFSEAVLRIYERAKQTVPNCTRCLQCEEKCPYKLPITKLIREKLSWLESQLKSQKLV